MRLMHLSRDDETQTQHNNYAHRNKQICEVCQHKFDRNNWFLFLQTAFQLGGKPYKCAHNYSTRLYTWWCHQMETFSALLALCAGNSPATGEFPTKRPVMRSFDVFFDLCLNKRLSKQSWGWWFETPLCSLWRHCNVTSTHTICAAQTTEPKCQEPAIPGIFVCA